MNRICFLVIFCFLSLLGRSQSNYLADGKSWSISNGNLKTTNFSEDSSAIQYWSYLQAHYLPIDILNHYI